MPHQIVLHHIFQLCNKYKRGHGILIFFWYGVYLQWKQICKWSENKHYIMKAGGTRSWKCQCHDPCPETRHPVHLSKLRQRTVIKALSKLHLLSATLISTLLSPLDFYVIRSSLNAAAMLLCYILKNLNLETMHINWCLQMQTVPILEHMHLLNEQF